MFSNLRHVKMQSGPGALSFSGSSYAVAVQTEGKIVIVGGFTTADGVRKNGVARLNYIGQLIRCCRGHKMRKAPIYYVTRLNTDGSLDPTFNTD